MKVTIGAAAPRRGNALSRGLGRGLLRIMGWRLEGEIPNLPKMVAIGAPHTSNTDGLIALASLAAMGLEASTMIKDSAFKGIMGRVLHWLGAVPINRDSPKGVVEQAIDAFAAREQFMLLMAPEGTRRSAETWKRGFYNVALGAGVPVLPAACDYRSRTITLGPPLYPTGDFAQDLDGLLAFYRDNSSPRHADRLSRPLCEAQGKTFQPKAD